MDNLEDENNKHFVSQTDYKNDNLRVEAKQLPGCQVTLTIRVSPKATLAAHHKAVKAINKEVSLPGFRKGKAPEPMILKNYGSYVEQEWKEILVQTAFQEAVKLTKLYPLNENAIKKPHLKSISKQEGAKLEIEFESAPKVPEIPHEELQLKRVEREEVTEQQLNQSLENIQVHHAIWHEVEDRAVREGDYIDVDIQDEDNPENIICKDTRFEVAEGKIGDWMRKIVIGKKLNEVVTGISEPSEELKDKSLFTPTNCKITIKAIKTATLPEIDDELAKKVGLANVDQLKEKVSTNLNDSADKKVRQQLREQLEQLIIEKFPFDVPASLVKKEVANRLEARKAELKKSGNTSDQIEKKIDELRSQVESETKKAFQLFFIARQIGDQNNISVTQNELVKELMMQMYTRESAVDSSLDSEEVRTNAYISLLSQKVFDFLVSRAQIE